MHDLQVDKESPRKELVLSERQAKLTRAVQKFRPGQVVKGQIHRIEDYGALVNIVLKGKATGVQGLLHKSELSWDLVMRTDDVVQEGMNRVVATSFEDIIFLAGSPNQLPSALLSMGLLIMG